MRPRPFRRALTGLAVAIVTLGVTACSSPVPDADAQDEVVQDYLGAVQAGDRARVAELVSPGVEATAEIDAKVRAIGGRPWTSVSIRWHRGEFPAVASAEITAVDGAGQRIEETVVLGKVEDEWFVSLGEARDLGTPAGTARP